MCYKEDGPCVNREKRMTDCGCATSFDSSYYDGEPSEGTHVKMEEWELEVGRVS